MVNNVKITLVYHLYCKDVNAISISDGNVYNEINRRCLKHFHALFDAAIFCICVDNTGDSFLIQKAIEWIWSCGFKDNVTIKIKPNSPYRDAQTFYDEVATCLDKFEGMVFFSHNKGNTFGEIESIKQWIASMYFSCLDNIDKKINNLALDSVVHGYTPFLDEDNHFGTSLNKWILPGGFFLFNPAKVFYYLEENNKKIPIFHDRFYAESFISNIFDIKKSNSKKYGIIFDNEERNVYFDGFFNFYNGDHFKLLNYFLKPERINEYEAFYRQMSGGA